jgi:hypothetical protein
LGGSLRLAKVLTKLDTADWSKIEHYLRKSIPQHLQYVPEGKLKAGPQQLRLRHYGQQA